MGEEGEPRLKAYLEEYPMTCSLCSNELTEPKILDCLHAFCMVCVEDYMVDKQEDGKFPCPACQLEQDVPEGGAAELDSSILQLSIQKVSKVMQQEETICTSCAENPAETACYTCGEFLCPDCEEKHGSLKATRDHNTCPVNELQMAENLVKFQRERFEICDKHGELKKLFCKKCDVELCNVCVYDDGHQKHDVTSIHNKVDKEIDLVAKKVDQLEKDREGHEENIATVQEKLGETQDNQQMVLDKIDGYTQQMHEMIDTYKAGLIAHVTTECTSQMRDMKAKIATHMSQMHMKVKLTRDSTILQELPLGSILPSCTEILKQAERCKRPYVITRAQLDRSNPTQDFIGRDAEMTVEAIDNTLKSLVGYTVPIPASATRSVIVTDSDHITDAMQKQATDLFHDVIDEHATATRSTATFKAMAKEINDRWKKRRTGGSGGGGGGGSADDDSDDGKKKKDKKGSTSSIAADWKCHVGVPGLNGKAGFSGKKHNLRVEIEGFEIHLFEMEIPEVKSKKRF